MPEVPSKTYLDAEADQSLAAVRDMRAELAALCGEGDRLFVLADSLAALLREQFPHDAALGRITLAVAGGLEAIRSATESRGVPLERPELAAVAALAAERLDRGESRG